MNRSTKLILLSLAVLSLFACAHSAEVKTTYTLLRVENHSPVDIFISLEAEEFKESFGGIPPCKSKGIGFSPLRFGDMVTIHYSEESIDENERFALNTNAIKKFSGEIDEVIFRYLGSNQWNLILLDTAGHESVLQ
jgi:hypothetical protein